MEKVWEYRKRLKEEPNNYAATVNEEGLTWLYDIHTQMLLNIRLQGLTLLLVGMVRIFMTKTYTSKVTYFDDKDNNGYKNVHKKCPLK